MEKPILPFKKILCPLDFSEPSYVALKAGRELSFHFKAQLALVHVLHAVPTVPERKPPGQVSKSVQEINIPLYEQELEATAREALRDVAAENLADFDVDLFVLHGEPAPEIVRLASEQGMDLIVIATHGWTGWRQSVFGSVAERVVRLAPCPVLSIRSPGDW